MGERAKAPRRRESDPRNGTSKRNGGGCVGAPVAVAGRGGYTHATTPPRGRLWALRGRG